ncbi:MAG TPA: TetR/AcrR family transcriptional regulator [Candidatus Angelobacter sp.]|nr:TetR/AcrR family transcriptional regulator [Candidatus Angelobacter sp.]
MPRKRLEHTRDEKVEEILTAAEERLREGGWEALSIAGIARDLGVAQNAVYWYFPSKEFLFVQALRRMLDRIIATTPPSATGPADQVLWFAEELQSLHRLRASLAERARTSPVLAGFANEVSGGLRGMLTNALAGHIPDDELPLAVETFIATVDGAVLENRDPEDRRRLLMYALERILRQPQPV